ncbi:MAG: glycosyltransferase family 2 protein [Raoultibacter sp.]
MIESKAAAVLKVSVVIPCYYSEKTIARVVCATRDELLRAGYDYEFILVNDGSTDATFAEITRLGQEDSAIKGIDLMRNFGQHNAIMAGLREVSGDWVMLMDDDMQTHPSQCPLLLDKMSEGFDVVFVEYFQHKESCLRRAGSRFAMWSIRVLAGCPKNITDSNFFIMTRQVCDELTRYESPRVYVQGLIFRTTNRIANVGVEHFDRDQGASGYTLKSLISLWSTILNFSVTPLRLSSLFGVLFGGAGLVGAIILFVRRLADPEMPLGWASTMVAILVCAGAIMLCLGFVGEYVGRLFMAANHHPQFIVRQQKNCALPKEDHRG